MFLFFIIYLQTQINYIYQDFNIYQQHKYITQFVLSHNFMEIDRLPLQTLNLSVKYVSHWTWLQALRQLYQNFMDACVQKYPDYKLLHRIDLNPNQVIFKQAKRNGNLLELKQTNYISYNKIKKQLIFDNEKSFPIKCLLMGCSQKGPEALGQFGQGMKISMIILLKAGIDIMIQSGEYSYYPTIKSWDHNQLFKNQYDHEVLYIKILKKPSSDKTKVILDNVTQQKFQQFLYLSLALLNEQKFQKLTFGGSSLIIPKDPKLVGKIYKKGVRLQLHESENSQKYKHYSYDFDSVSVGRQRDCVNNVWDLYKLQSQLHYNVILKSLDKAFLIQNPQFKPIFRDHLQNIYQFLKINGMQTHYFHTYSKNNKNVCDAIYDKFLQQNNTTQIYPQYDSVIGSIVRYLNMYGLKNQFYPSVHVSWELWHTLVYSTKYIKIQDKIERDILSKQMRELTPQQQATINQIKQKIVHVEPGVNDFGIKVKNFKELYCCKDKDKNKKIIYVNPQKIKQVNQMTKQLCKMLLI